MLQIIRSSKLGSPTTVDTFTKGCFAVSLNPSKKDLARISDALPVAAGLLLSITDPDELPRLRQDDTHTVIIVRAMAAPDQPSMTTPISLVFDTKHTFLAALGVHKTEVFDSILDGTAQVDTRKPLDVILAVCASLVEAYEDKIASLEQQLQIKPRTMTAIRQHDIIHLVELEETLNGLITALEPSVIVMEKMIAYDAVPFSKVDTKRMHDILQDANQVLHLAQTNLQSIQNIRDGYSTVLSVTLNQTMKMLTYVTVIFTIPMIVAGIYGMNIKLPFDQSAYALYYIFGLIIGIIFLVVMTFMLIRRRM